MHSMFKKSIVLITIAALLIIPLCSEALAWEQTRSEAPGGAAMIADFLVLRPVGIIGLVTGYTFFVLSSPFSAWGGNIATAWDQMVAAPAKFTFARPLGEF